MDNQSERMKPMKTQPYFQTIITSGSIEERDRRIAELTIREFEVVRFFENIVESASSRTGLINGRQLIKHSYDGGSNRATYGAILRRANEKVREKNKSMQSLTQLKHSKRYP